MTESQQTESGNVASDMIVLERRQLSMPDFSTPSVLGVAAVSSIDHDGVVVVISANGSGKSRFGAWLEAPAGAGVGPPVNTGAQLRALRISAQRVLAVPDQAPRSTERDARRRLDDGGTGPFHGTSRVGGTDPIAGQLNDYATLVETLLQSATVGHLDSMRRGEEKFQPRSPKHRF